MTALLAIDPGVHESACAVFRADVLEAVGFARYGMALSVARLSPFARVVVERPEYQGKRTEAARVQDLIALSWEGAKLAAALAAQDDAWFVELTPSQWKGSSPKPVVHAALWGALTAAERHVLGGAKTHAAITKALERGAAKRWPPNAHMYPSAWPMHNILDAVAMGAFYLGRIKKG
jgi:hypothetical protein